MVKTYNLITILVTLIIASGCSSEKINSQQALQDTMVQSLFKEAETNSEECPEFEFQQKQQILLCGNSAESFVNGDFKNLQTLSTNNESVIKVLLNQNPYYGGSEPTCQNHTLVYHSIFENEASRITISAVAGHQILKMQTHLASKTDSDKDIKENTIFCLIKDTQPDLSVSL